MNSEQKLLENVHLPSEETKATLPTLMEQMLYYPISLAKKT